MSDPNFSFGWRLYRLAGGLAYLTLLAWVCSQITHSGFLWSFLAILGGVAFCAGLALFWLTQWALRDDSRPRQFGLASLFYVTTLTAVYFSMVRWLVIGLSGRVGFRAESEWLLGWFFVGVICLVLAFIAVPVVIGMSEALVWLAVWIVRRRVVRRWLGKRREQPRE